MGRKHLALIGSIAIAAGVAIFLALFFAGGTETNGTASPKNNTAINQTEGLRIHDEPVINVTKGGEGS